MGKHDVLVDHSFTMTLPCYEPAAIGLRARATTAAATVNTIFSRATDAISAGGRLLLVPLLMGFQKVALLGFDPGPPSAPGDFAPFCNSFPARHHRTATPYPPL